MKKITLSFKSDETFEKFMGLVKLMPSVKVVNVGGDEAKNGDKPVLVDLGLPSGTLWADRNLGADHAHEYGGYYRFGETTPLTKDSTEYKYDEIDGDIAGTQRDAATAMLGGRFHMPTDDQIRELTERCEWKWTEVAGVKGMTVTGPNGNSIFLPAAGYRDDSSGSLSSVGSYGYYWSATPVITNYGRDLYFNSSYWSWNSNYRALGFSVRPVAERN